LMRSSCISLTTWSRIFSGSSAALTAGSTRDQLPGPIACAKG
jgi:hypothetical protein